MLLLVGTFTYRQGGPKKTVQRYDIVPSSTSQQKDQFCRGRDIRNKEVWEDEGKVPKQYQVDKMSWLILSRNQFSPNPLKPGVTLQHTVTLDSRKLPKAMACHPSLMESP